jgi:hypothetical protein
MHPDDVRTRDIAWIMGPEPKLPSLRQKNGGIYGFVGFDGKERFSTRYHEWSVPDYDEVCDSAEYRWARDDLEDRHGYATMARMKLLLSWPEPGETLDRWIKALEEALDHVLGITKPLADSNSPSGESEKRLLCENCLNGTPGFGFFCARCKAKLYRNMIEAHTELPR